MLSRFGSCVVVICMVGLFAARAEAVIISCNKVQNGLVSCVGFLQGRTLVPQCCNGIKAVAGAAKSATDRRAVCGCLKAAAKAYGKSFDLGKAATLPSRCGVNIPFKISPDTDCSRVR